jgi:two-component system sensor histidine kinase DegS
LAAKEALTNIQKHARATEIWVRVRFEAPLLEIAIEDNGAGFNLSEAPSERNGLQNMQARLGTLKGTCSITSEPGKGTRLVMRVSLPPAEAGEERQRSI